MSVQCIGGYHEYIGDSGNVISQQYHDKCWGRSLREQLNLCENPSVLMYPRPPPPHTHTLVMVSPVYSWYPPVYGICVKIGLEKSCNFSSRKIGHLQRLRHYLRSRSTASKLSKTFCLSRNHFLYFFHFSFLFKIFHSGRFTAATLL